MLAANCDLASSLMTGNPIWRGNVATESYRHHHKSKVLMASCTEIQLDKVHFLDSKDFDKKWFGFVAKDCVNGTLMPQKHLPKIDANYTLIHEIFQQFGLANKMEVDVDKIPYETDITIYNKTKVSYR
jgi:hypothetical protein